MIFVLALFAACAAKDYIFSVALGYKEDVVEPFVVSLRWSGYDGEIWLAVRDSERNLLDGLSERYRITLMPVEPTQTKKVTIERLMWYRSWLNELENEDRVLITDLRDVFFQANPFLYHYVIEDGNVQLFAENNTIGNCRFNSAWIRDCYGERELANLADKLIVNGGTMLGSMFHVANLVGELIVANNLNVDCEEDQGAINYVFYTDLHRRGAILNRQGYGAVNTIGQVPESSLKLGRYSLFVLNEDGARSALIHQYDRHAVLQQHYMRLVPFMKYILERNKDK